MSTIDQLLIREYQANESPMQPTVGSLDRQGAGERGNTPAVAPTVTRRAAFRVVSDPRRLPSKHQQVADDVIPQDAPADLAAASRVSLHVVHREDETCGHDDDPNLEYQLDSSRPAESLLADPLPNRQLSDDVELSVVDQASPLSTPIDDATESDSYSAQESWFASTEESSAEEPSAEDHAEPEILWPTLRDSEVLQWHTPVEIVAGIVSLDELLHERDVLNPSISQSLASQPAESALGQRTVDQASFQHSESVAHRLPASTVVTPGAGPVAAAGDESLSSAPECGVPSSAAKDFVVPWEVEQFRWPTICHRLTKRTCDQLDPMINYLQTRAASAPVIMLLTSLSAGEGCTTMGLTLAKRAAQQGLRVLLVDGDFAACEMSRRLGVTPVVSLSDVLIGDQPVAEACLRSTHDGLCLMANTAGSPANDEASPSNNMRRSFASVVANAAPHFDVVLVDGGEFDSAATTSILSAWPEAVAGKVMTVVVRDVRKTSAEQVVEAVRQRDSLRCEWLEAIENFVPVESLVEARG